MYCKVNRKLQKLPPLSKMAVSLPPEVDREVSDPSPHRRTVCLFVLRFYGPVNPMGSCRARSVYLITRLLGRLSSLSG